MHVIYNRTNVLFSKTYKSIGLKLSVKIFAFSIIKTPSMNVSLHYQMPSFSLHLPSQAFCHADFKISRERRAACLHKQVYVSKYAEIMLEKEVIKGVPSCTVLCTLSLFHHSHIVNYIHSDFEISREGRATCLHRQVYTKLLIIDIFKSVSTGIMLEKEVIKVFPSSPYPHHHCFF